MLPPVRQPSHPPGTFPGCFEPCSAAQASESMRLLSPRRYSPGPQGCPGGGPSYLLQPHHPDDDYHLHKYAMVGSVSVDPIGIDRMMFQTYTAAGPIRKISSSFIRPLYFYLLMLPVYDGRNIQNVYKSLWLYMCICIFLCYDFHIFLICILCLVV